MSDTFGLAYRTKDIAIYENKQVMQRAYAVHTVRQVTDGAEALQVLRARGDAPRKEVILESAAPLPPDSGGAPSDQEVRIESYSPMRVDLKASMQGDGYVVLSDTYFPGWKALVDGGESLAYRANYLFRAVYVPAGKHQVTFIYEPKALWDGAAISFTAFTLTSIATGVVAVRSRRSSPQDERAPNLTQTHPG
jgi:hypothetical protein